MSSDKEARKFSRNFIYSYILSVLFLFEGNNR